MKRGWARLLVLPALLCLGCDNALVVRPYAGTIIQMQWSGASASPAGTHLEMWARDSFDAIIRVDGSFTYRDDCDAKEPGKVKVIYPFGLQIRKAITFDDPCMIDEEGNLLTTAAAYDADTVISGTRQTPDQQAQIVLNRIAQVTNMADGGRQANTLLAVVPADETPLPQIPAGTPAAERLRICRQDYWCKSPVAYTPNPAQLTAPLHGTAYGFIAYTTTSPASGYDSIRMDSPTKLKGTREIWFTVENVPADQVTARLAAKDYSRGPVFLQGKQTPGGNDVLHFDLTGPSAGGTAALLVNLDDDDIVF